MADAQGTILALIFEGRRYVPLAFQGTELEFDIFLVLDGHEVRFVMESV